MNFCIRTEPPASQISGGIDALSFERDSIDFWTSDSFGGSAKEMLIST